LRERLCRMKLKYKINLVSLSILITVSCAIAAAGVTAINQLSYDLNQRLMSKEVNNLVATIGAAHQVLKDSGVGGVESYVRRTQEDLLAEFRNYRFGSTGRIMIVEKADAGLLYNPFEGPEPVEPGFLAEMIRMGKGTLEFPGERRMHFFSFDTYTEWNWLVVLSVATEEMIEVRKRFLTNVVFILLPSLILGGMLFLWFTSRIVKPIHQLATAAASVSRGEWDTPLPTPHTRDEVAQLTIAFREMAARLAASYRNLQENLEKIERSQEERARLVTAIEQAAEGIVVSDTRWVIQYVNPAFEHITGYGRSEIIGQHGRVLKSDKHEQAFYKRIRETLSQGDVWSARMTNKRKDGSLCEVEVTASPVRDDSGTIINYVGVHRDITHEIRLEKELRQAQKMEALGRLAGGIAHDFNNILMGIIGYTEMALYKAPAGHSIQHYLKRVLDGSSRASDLVKQILTFSRQSEQERKLVHIAPIVSEGLKLLRSTLPSTIQIHQDIAVPQEEWVVLADPTQIHQVLMNLCTNAAHAMRVKGGVLSVSLSAVQADAQISQHSTPTERSYVCLAVSDTGHGMDAAVMERIFDPYFTTKKIGEGTGMGLAVVQGIVKSWGGVITVSSEPDKGTTFYVFLPRIEEELQPTVETLVTPATGTERILFVDDEKILVDLGKEILGSLGYCVSITTSSLEALETFRAQPGDFDLVITDMTMPDLNGSELARELMAIRSDIPIILCTGFSEMIDENKAKEAGIREFVMKPYVVSDIANVIRKVLEQT
jgi:PAS domain S-box-containing protein